jgi:hypothetical protein
MLQFPRWRVDVVVDGDVVKTFHETATTSKAAIDKAKHKMRGAVSNAGPFKFKAVRTDAGTAHATKAPPKSQRDMYYDAERRSADINNTFLEMLPTMRRRDLEKLIEKRPALWGRFAGYLKSGHVFADDPPAGGRQHAVKKSPAQLDREINEILGRGPRTHHARVASAAPMIGQSSAGFDIHTDHEDVVEDNARERFGPDYGDAADRAKRVKEGLVDEQGKITKRGWELLNKDIAALERNALGWLRKTFGNASDQGHDAQGGLIGSVSFDPLNVSHARNILMGKNERIDFSDSSYGDFAREAWKGVSTFGQEVLGGSINFFDIDQNALDIAEETVDRADRRKRR